MNSSKRGLRFISVLLLFSLLAASCGGGGGDDTETADTAAVGFDADQPNTESIVIDSDLPSADELEKQLAAEPTATPLPMVDPDLFTAPTPTPEKVRDPWEVFILKAKPDTGLVPVFDAPNGNEFELRFENLDGSSISYPLQNPTYFDEALVLMVVEGEPGDDWAKVMLPIRPNESTAWVQTAFFDWNTNNYHIDINITTNEVTVWKGDEEIVSTVAVTGRESAPTPVLESYIDEKIPGLNAAYGPWILSIAGFSESMDRFSNALPKLALHGTDSPQLMGQYVSSGCIRVENEIIELIANTVPVGAKVSIFR